MKAPIDFSTYTNEQLEHSSLFIDRVNNPVNYSAIIAEIDKRKKTRDWDVYLEQKKLRFHGKLKKTLTVLAILQCLSCIWGFVQVLYYIPAMINSSAFSLKLLFSITLMCAFIGLGILSGYLFWKSKRDSYNLWKVALILQIPLLYIGSIKYMFSSGFSLIIDIMGLNSGNISASIGPSSFSIGFNTPNNGSTYLAINLVAVIILLLLRKYESKT